MGGGRARLLRNAVGGLTLLLLVAAVALGLPAVDRALPSARAVANDMPYPVGASVTVVPPPGAALDLTRTRPGPDRGAVLFTLDGVRYALVATPFDGDLDAAADRLRRRITANTGYQVTGGETRTATASGVAGVRGQYHSPGRTGRYAAFVARGLAVEVTVSGPDVELRQRLPVIDRSIATLEFGEPG